MADEPTLFDGLDDEEPLIERLRRKWEPGPGPIPFSLDDPEISMDATTDG